MAPGDAELRLLCAANLAQIGLRTLALGDLAVLPSEVAGDPGVARLRAACEALAADEVPGEEASRLCAMNVECLRKRAMLGGLDAGELLATWKAAAREDRWFRALDGNIVRVRGMGEGRQAGGDAPALLLFGDHRGAAERFAAEHLVVPPGSLSSAFASQYTLEGANPPWLLMQVAARVPRHKDGFWPTIMLVQADPLELLDGLALADLRDVLSQERLMAFIGAEASARLGEALRERMERQISGPLIPLLSTRMKANPAVAQVLDEARRQQTAEHERLLAKVREVYAGRNAGWWRARYQAAMGRTDRPLRVLVPTTRYSTYVQHSSADLVKALERCGHEARLLIEPDDFSRMSSPAYLRSLDEFQPDLVVLINYYRGTLGEIFPREVPFVCWIQDSMPHHFVPAGKGGAGQGELDFIVGHLHEELFTRCGHTRERALAFPVVVSTEKFHAAPVEADQRRRLECEIAFVSHHSETPERMHERLVREARSGAGPVFVEIIQQLRDRVIEIGRDPMGSSTEGAQQTSALRALVGQVMRDRLGREPQDSELLPVFRQYALPLAERALRHQTVEWAADAARRFGWRLHLYGRGWDEVEHLRDFAKGTGSHGEELRAIYQCAAVQLHVSATALVHQRIMECALSGGLPVCRMTRQEADTVQSAARRAAYPRIGPEACDIETRRLGWRIASEPGLMAMTALMQRLGVEPRGQRDGFYWSNPPPPEMLAGTSGQMALERRCDWVLGDLAELSFQDAAGLEAVVRRAIEMPTWRSGMSALVARRIRERLTHEALIDQMLGLIARSLGG